MGCGARTQTLPIARKYLTSAYIQGVSQLLTSCLHSKNVVKMLQRSFDQLCKFDAKVKALLTLLL